MESNGKLLILSGGSLNGLAYLGLFRYLETSNYNANQFKIYGTSIGGILGMFWKMGFDSETMIRLFAKFPFFPASNINNLLTNGGLDDGKNLEYLFIEILKIKFNCTNFNELTLSKFPGIYLCTCDIHEKNTIYLSSDNYPNLPVHIALRMTCNLPFIFEPVQYMNKYYVDGAILENTPLPPPSIENCDSIAIFCIFVKKNTTGSYFNHIMDCSSIDRFKMYEKYIEKIFPKCIVLNFPKSFEIYDFWVPIEEKNKQILEGYRVCKNNIKLNQILDHEKHKDSEKQENQKVPEETQK